MDETRFIVAKKYANSKAAQGAGVEPGGSLSSINDAAPQKLVTSVTTTTTPVVTTSSSILINRSSSTEMKQAGTIRTTNPDAINAALRQLHALEKPAQKRTVQKITVIDPKKLQQLGLDRKIAEALSKQKLASRQETKVKVDAVEGLSSEPTLDISKLTPAERLAHAKKILSQKLLAIVPSKSKKTATAAAASTSTVKSTVTSTSLQTSSAQTQNNVYTTGKLDVEKPNVIRKLPVLPPKSPQEIARALDFNNMNKKQTKLDSNVPQFVHNFHLKKQINSSEIELISKSDSVKTINMIKLPQQPQKSQIQPQQESTAKKTTVQEDLTKMKGLKSAKSYSMTKEQSGIQETRVLQTATQQPEPAKNFANQLPVDKSASQIQFKEQLQSMPLRTQKEQLQSQKLSNSMETQQLELNLSSQLPTHLMVDSNSKVNQAKTIDSKTIADTKQVPEAKENPKSRKMNKVTPQLLQKQSQPKLPMLSQLPTFEQKQQQAQSQTQQDPMTQLRPKLQTTLETIKSTSQPALSSSQWQPSTGKQTQPSSVQSISNYSALARPAKRSQQNDLTYENIFENFNSIPKASIKKSEIVISPQNAQPQVSASKTKIKRSYNKKKNSTFPQLSPLKHTFPTATLPQDAPLPKISTFKKPPLPIPKESPEYSRNITISVTDNMPVSMKSHPHNLIVLEDKVLTPEEKLNLKLNLSLLGLNEHQLENDATSPTFGETPLVNTETLVEKHSELPAIGATVSTDPRQGSAVVNATQPKKFIIAPDKLKLSKDKIAALAKQIRTQALQQQGMGQQKCVPTVSNVQPSQQLQTRMSRSGSVIHLGPSPLIEPAVEKSYVGGKKSVVSSNVTMTTTQAAKSESNPNLVKEHVNKLESHQYIRDQNSRNATILQNVSSLKNVREENIGSMPHIPRAISFDSAHINTIQPTTQFEDPSIKPAILLTSIKEKPKIIKILSHENAQLIQSEAAVKHTPASERPSAEHVNISEHKYTDSSPIVPPIMVKKSSPAVCIFNDPGLDDSSISAVDFIASLAASTDYTKSSPFKLSAEEEKLNATLEQSFSDLKPRRKIDLSSSSSLNATALLTEMPTCDYNSLKNRDEHKSVESPETSKYIKTEVEAGIIETKTKGSSKGNQVYPLHKMYQSASELIPTKHIEEGTCSLIISENNINQEDISNNTTVRDDSVAAYTATQIQNPSSDKIITVLLHEKGIPQVSGKKQFILGKSSDSEKERNDLSKKQEEHIGAFLPPKQKFYTEPNMHVNLSHSFEQMNVPSEINLKESMISECHVMVRTQESQIGEQKATKEEGSTFSKSPDVPKKGSLSNEGESSEDSKILRDDLNKKQTKPVETFVTQPRKEENIDLSISKNREQELNVQSEVNVEAPKLHEMDGLIRTSHETLSDGIFSHKQKSFKEEEETLSKKQDLSLKERNIDEQESSNASESIESQERKIAGEQQEILPENPCTESVVATDSSSHPASVSDMTHNNKKEEVLKVESQNIQPNNSDVPNAEDQMKNQKRVPRLKKAKINLVPRKKSVATNSETLVKKSIQSNENLEKDILTVEANTVGRTHLARNSEKVEKNYQTDQVMTQANDLMPDESLTVSDGKSGQKQEMLSPEVAVPQSKSTSSKPLVLTTISIDSLEIIPTKPMAMVENDSDDLGLTPHAALEILQGTNMQQKSQIISINASENIPVSNINEQKEKETEAAQILVSLIRPPPPRDEEQALPEPKIPFKRISVEETKNTEKVIGIQNLLKQIEDNQLKKPSELKPTTENKEDQVKVAPTTENASSNQMPQSAEPSGSPAKQTVMLVSQDKEADLIPHTQTLSKEAISSSQVIEDLKNTVLNVKQKEEAKKQNIPSISRISKKEKTDEKSSEVLITDEISSDVNTSLLATSADTSSECLMKHQSESEESIVQTLSEKSKNVLSLDSKTENERLTYVSQSYIKEINNLSENAGVIKADNLEEKKTANETKLENKKGISEQTRGLKSKSPSTVEVTCKENPIRNSEETISIEAAQLENTQKLSAVALKTEKSEKSETPSVKVYKKRTPRSKSKDLISSLQNIEAPSVSNPEDDTTTVNANELNISVEKKRTRRSESKTPVDHSSISDEVNMTKTDVETASEDSKNLVNVNSSLLIEKESEKVGEIKNYGEKQNTHRSKLNAVEKDLQINSEDVVKRPTLGANKVNEKQGDSKVEKPPSLPNVTAKAIIESSVTETAKSVGRRKRGPNTKATAASSNQTREEGETVAKKPRKCSLVSFETSFIVQPKIEGSKRAQRAQWLERQLEPLASNDQSLEVEAFRDNTVSRTHSNHRLESKQSTVDTQSDIDMTDMDYSTIEGSHEETTREESSQDSRINTTGRKRLRKTIDDIKRGRGTEINTDDTDSYGDNNEDINDFLGFEEYFLNAEDSDILVKKEHSKSTTENSIKEQHHVMENMGTNVSSCGEKSCSGQIKDWLTTGKAGQPPTPKAIGKKVYTTSSMKQTTKSIPLKKRWELVQKRKNIETDITDDTSPAQDDDDNVIVEKKIPQTIQNQEIFQDYNKETNSETIIAMKFALVPESEEVKSSRDHIFTKPHEKHKAACVKHTDGLETATMMGNVEKAYCTESANTTVKSRKCNSTKPMNSVSDEVQSTAEEKLDLLVPIIPPPRKRGRKSTGKGSDIDKSASVLPETPPSKTETPETEGLAAPLPTSDSAELANTPLKGKRGRGKSALTSPEETKKDSVTAMRVSDNPAAAQEGMQNTLLPAKRFGRVGRKPKRFFEDVVAQTEIRKTSTPVKDSKVSEQSINEPIASTSLNTTTGARKRGRKPQQCNAVSPNTTPTVVNNVIADSTEEQLSSSKRRRKAKTATQSSQDTSTSVIENANEPKSIIEIFTSSLSTNKSSKRWETCNEKLEVVQKNAVNSETLGDKVDDKLCDKKSEKTNQEPVCNANSKLIVEKAPVGKQKGRKRNESKETLSIPALTDITKYNKDSIYPRILLITRREQLDNDETLTSKDGPPGDGYVKCALCFGNALKSKWTQHVCEHYGIGWKVGKPPQDISSSKNVINLVIAFLKEHNIKGLNCRICHRLYRSGMGVITHLENCGISYEEQLKNRVICEYCKNSYTPLSIKTHARTCNVRIVMERKKTYLEEQAVIVEERTPVFNNVGRVKRNAQMKAENKLKVIGEQLSTEPTPTQSGIEPEKHFRIVERLNIADHKAKCLSDLEKSGKVFCVRKDCRFTGMSFEEFAQHVAECSFIPKPGYYCLLCKRSNKVFTSQKTVVHHVLKKHGEGTEDKDFVASEGSECKFDGNETSSEECSSGVDSNEEADKDDSESEGVNDDIAEDAKSQRKKRSGYAKPHHKKPAYFTDQKQLFLSRDVMVNKIQLKERWKQFCKNNFTDQILFDSGVAQFNVYKVCGENNEKILPYQEVSMKFALSDGTKIYNIFGIPEERDNWRQLKRFETLAEKSDIFTFIGGPLKSLAWAPLPDLDDSTQYLAIGYRKDYDKYTRSLNPKISPTLIVIFKVNMKATDAESRIQLHYAVRIPHGPVHCFEFLPSGGYDLNSNRLGLLLVGSASSELQVYALPLDINSAILEKDTGVKTDSSKPIMLELKPVFTLSLGLCNMQQTETAVTIQCTCLKWSEFYGHNTVVAGFSNGFIGIWDISGNENDNLNSFVLNDTRHFVPLNYFFTGERGVRDFGLHYDTKGPRWLAVCSIGRNDLIYDLRDLTNPKILRDDFPKNTVAAVEWPTTTESIMYLMSDSFVNNGSCAVLRSPLTMFFNNSKVETMLTSVNRGKFNPYHNVFYSVTDNGDILFHNLSALYGSIRRKISHSIKLVKAISTLDVKCLNGEKMPQAKDKNEKSLYIIDPEYKEKYGLVFGPIVKIPKKDDKAFTTSTRMPPFYARPFTRINCVSCNLNASTSKLTAFGYENGFLRIISFNESKYLE